MTQVCVCLVGADGVLQGWSLPAARAEAELSRAGCSLRRSTLIGKASEPKDVQTAIRHSRARQHGASETSEFINCSNIPIGNIPGEDQVSDPKEDTAADGSNPRPLTGK